jgi:hypothetical protein
MCHSGDPLRLFHYPGVPTNRNFGIVLIDLIISAEKERKTEMMMGKFPKKAIKK